MNENFIVHTKKIQIMSWKMESEMYPGYGKNRPVKSKASFFKDLLPGDIIELSFELKSTSGCKNYMTTKAWRGNKYLGERKDTFNMIANGLWCFNLKEIN